MFCQGQELVYEDVRWGEAGVVKSKLHIKEVIKTDSLSASLCRKHIGDWLEERFIATKKVYKYGFYGVTGDWEWHKDRRQPLIVDDSLRIFTSFLKCENCAIGMRGTKQGGDGYFRLDIQIKEGRFLLVMSDFYGIDEDSFLAIWLLKRGALIKRPDHRIDILESSFTSIKGDLIEFIMDSHNQSKGSVDDW
jgi:hypothetical protein